MFKPNHFSTIILKKPGMIVPKDILQLTMKENPSCCGFAIQALTEDNKPMLFVDKHDRLPDISKIETLQNEAKDYWMTLFFSKFDGKFDKELVQPFTLFGGEEDDPHVAVFMEGDFPQFSDAGEMNAEEYRLAYNYLFPKINQLNRLTKGDMNALREEMETEQFNTELIREIGHRGMFTMMFQEGEPLCFGKNELGGEFEWGATSNLHKYDEEKEQAPVEKKETLVSKARKRFGISMDDAPKDTPPVEKPKEEVKKENPPGVHTIPPKTEDISTSQKVGGHYWSPPKNLTGRHLKKAIRKMAGLQGNQDLPQGWNSPDFKLWIADTPAGPIKDLKDMGKVLDMKTQEPRPVLTAPSITDDERTKAQEFVKKHLDSNSNVISSMEDMAKAEEKWASFSEKVTPMENTFKWPAEKAWTFFTNNPKASFLMWLEYRRSLYNFLAKDDKTSGTKPEDVAPKETETKTPEVTKKRARFGIGGGAFNKSAA